MTLPEAQAGRDRAQAQLAELSAKATGLTASTERLADEGKHCQRDRLREMRAAGEEKATRAASVTRTTSSLSTRASRPRANGIRVNFAMILLLFFIRYFKSIFACVQISIDGLYGRVAVKK